MNESGTQQCCNDFHCGGVIPTNGLDHDLGARAGGEPHDLHDILGVCRALVADEQDVAIELAGGMYQPRRSTALQTNEAGHLDRRFYHCILKKTVNSKQARGRLAAARELGTEHQRASQAVLWCMVVYNDNDIIMQ